MILCEYDADFKIINLIQDSNEPDRIHSDDRLAIKQYIVTLMLTSSTGIQKQLSDAISIIGKYDFPEKWPQLIQVSNERVNILNCLIG